MSEPVVTCVLKSVANGTGEGPHWDEETQTLYFVDIHLWGEFGRILRWNYNTNVVDEIRIGKSFATFILPKKDGGFVTSLGRSVVQFDWDAPNEYRTIALVEEDHANPTRFNDAKCDSSGRIWAGTMGLESSPAVLEMEQGSLYSIDKNHTTTSFADKVSISNGLAWSRDDKTLYFIDSLPSRVYAFDFDSVSGVASNKRCLIELPIAGSANFIGIADGMCIDDEGMLWIACFDGGLVARYDPTSGNLLLTVKIPAKRPTSCCFGGPNYDELFVTTSRSGYTDKDIEDDPLAGSLFKVTGLGVKGFKPNVFIG